MREPRHTDVEAAAPDARARQAREQRVKDHLGRELPRAGVDSREAGVGGHEAGPGSYSGGDVDTGVTGVGTGGSGLAASGPDDVDRLAQAETTGGSEEFASGPPARGENQGERRGRAGGPKQVRGGTTHDRSGDDTATGHASADPDAGRAGGSPTAVGFTTPDQFGAGHVNIADSGSREDAGYADIDDVGANARSAGVDDDLDVAADDGDDDPNVDDASDVDVDEDDDSDADHR